MESYQIAALQAFNSGLDQTGPGSTNTQQSTTIDPATQALQSSQALQPTQTTNSSTLPNILEGATLIDRPDGWWKPEKTVPCTWEGCGQMFRCNHNVEQHIREKHTGERPYACSICADLGNESTFPRPGSLYRHMRIVHQVEPNVLNRRRPRVNIQRTRGPVTAVPAEQQQQPRRRGRRPRNAVEQPQPEPAAAPMPPPIPMQPAVPDNHSCDYCGQLLTGREHAMLHMHLEHGVPASVECSCSYCKNQLARQPPPQQLEPLGLLQPTVQLFSHQQPASQVAPQRPAHQPPTFQQTPPIRQPQPYRPVSPSQLERRLMTLQEQQSNHSPENDQSNGNAEFGAPIDPAPTPGLVETDEQMPDAPAPELGQDYFGIIDFSQSGDGQISGELSNDLNDLFSTSGPGFDF